MALSPLPVHRFRPLCIPSIVSGLFHHLVASLVVIFHLQRFDLIDVGLVGGKGREDGEQTRPDVGLFSCVQDVCCSMWLSVVWYSNKIVSVCEAS